MGVEGRVLLGPRGDAYGPRTDGSFDQEALPGADPRHGQIRSSRSALCIGGVSDDASSTGSPGPFSSGHTA